MWFAESQRGEVDKKKTYRELLIMHYTHYLSSTPLYEQPAQMRVPIYLVAGKGYGAHLRVICLIVPLRYLASEGGSNA